jgi:predicted nucleotidyltransferase
MQRQNEVDQILERIEQWARTRSDIKAIGLVGSWARDGARSDSDVDLVLITLELSNYVEDATWANVLPGAVIVKTRSWGSLTERRLALPSGLEVEVGVALPSWASTEPVDPGTRRVVADGLRIVYDPDGLLGALAANVLPKPRG